MPVNYQLGKIYKIVSNHGDKIYVGSTALPRLCTRLAKYRSEYKCWKNGGTSQYITSFDLFDEYRPENCEIILLESHSCSNKDELKLKERYYIELLSCVNKSIPGRTHKESVKAYYESNKDVINEKAKIKCICDVCGFGYTQANKNHHLKSKKHVSAVAAVVPDPQQSDSISNQPPV